ncbi:hypothetical protein E2C01_057276 [Portunus trituberculatus]|uniref:Uncharacterized protein n=1 Tax=Portunus trituberculatus TaxID=210409 RepID=A0A5B7GWC8_PORTR|nr:hypothetical protein [Portunus trituberculatus]
MSRVYLRNGSNVSCVLLDSVTGSHSTVVILQPPHCITDRTLLSDPNQNNNNNNRASRCSARPCETLYTADAHHCALKIKLQPRSRGSNVGKT